MDAFDKKIEELNAQLATAQKDLDNDPLQAQLEALRAKGDLVGSLQNQIAQLLRDKDQAINLQEQIDAATQVRDNLVAKVTPVEVAPAERIKP